MSENWKDDEPKWVPPDDGRIRRSPCEGRSIGQTTMDDEAYERAQCAPPEPGTEAGVLEDWGPTQVSQPPDPDNSAAPLGRQPQKQISLAEACKGIRPIDPPGTVYTAADISRAMQYFLNLRRQTRRSALKR